MKENKHLLLFVDTREDFMNKVLDILIIGGGPIGLACGIEAKKAKLNYVIVEKGTLVNSLYNYPLNMTFFLPRKDWKLAVFLLFL